MVILTEVVVFVPPGSIDYIVHVDLPVTSAQASSLGCESEFQQAQQYGILRTKPTKPGQVSVVEFPR